MKDQFDEKTEDAFKRVFSSMESSAIKKSAQEAIKYGTSFVKFENGSIINLDRSQVIKGE